MSSILASYYEPCGWDTPGSVDLFDDGNYFHLVMKPVTNEQLVQAIEQAKKDGCVVYVKDETQNFRKRLKVNF